MVFQDSLQGYHFYFSLLHVSLMSKHIKEQTIYMELCLKIMEFLQMIGLLAYILKSVIPGSLSKSL